MTNPYRSRVRIAALIVVATAGSVSADGAMGSPLDRHAAGSGAPVAALLPGWPGAQAHSADAGQGRAGQRAAESGRLTRAKELISDGRWLEAIPVLRTAAADVKEPNRDEALFWLAHSQNEAGHLAESVESIRRLQREFPSSRWARPAQSLLVELAHKLGRQDVLWWTAAPPPPPPRAPKPADPAPRALPAMPPAPRATPAQPPPPPPAPAPPAPWFGGPAMPDLDLRVQALGSLIQTDAQKAIPMLADIALETGEPGAARRAVFVLAQSRRPEAQLIVLDVAKRGAEPVRIAAVRELGRFGGPEVAGALLDVYDTADGPVKQQVVATLGERRDTASLLRIAHAEKDRQLRDAAIISLGRAGAREPLRLLYTRAARETRRAVILGLFNARDEEGLIRIAGQEKDPALREEVLSRLRLLGTPAATAYVEKLSRTRPGP